MLNYNDVTVRKYVILNGDPFECLSSHVFRKQQRKPVNQTKLRNMRSGKVIEHSFHGADKIEEADIETKKIMFLYHNKGEYWFCEDGERSKRFALEEGIFGSEHAFMKENSTVTALVFQDDVIGVRLPIKVELKVTEAPPAVKGNTAQGANKQITLESGTTVNAPLFINEGDIVRVNTETGEYVERVEKA